MGYWMCPECKATNKDYPEICSKCGWGSEESNCKEKLDSSKGGKDAE